LPLKNLNKLPPILTSGLWLLPLQWGSRLLLVARASLWVSCVCPSLWLCDCTAAVVLVGCYSTIFYIFFCVIIKRLGGSLDFTDLRTRELYFKRYRSIRSILDNIGTTVKVLSPMEEAIAFSCGCCWLPCPWCGDLLFLVARCYGLRQGQGGVLFLGAGIDASSVQLSH
jgi:hypothetical protein